MTIKLVSAVELFNDKIRGEILYKIRLLAFCFCFLQLCPVTLYCDLLERVIQDHVNFCYCGEDVSQLKNCSLM